MLLCKARWMFLLLSCFLLITIISCQDDLGDEEGKTTFVLSGNANGANERPTPVTTAGMGTITGSYDSKTKLLTYTINWTGLSGPPINMHFHGPADVNSAAGVAIGIPLPANPAPLGSVSSSATLTAQQEAELLGGLWYYNIHTDLNKPGEIRGQVIAQ